MENEQEAQAQEAPEWTPVTPYEDGAPAACCSCDESMPWWATLILSVIMVLAIIGLATVLSFVLS